jgi:hypothetical protein
MKTGSLKESPNILAVKSRRSNLAKEIDFERQTRLIRNLIWLYIILWLVEGGLRR